MLKRILAVAALAVLPVAQSQAAASPSLAQLQRQIEILAQEIEQLKGSGTGSASATAVRLGGYGEHHYNNFRNTESGAQRNDQVDAHRFVLFFGYDFSDRIRLQSEVELEHGLVAGDGSSEGEVELEQAFIEIDTSSVSKLKLGQFLLPVGILNESHEPDVFYGVERNVLEKNVIPASWWETGVMWTQDLGHGLSYDLALHSGLQVEDGYSIRGGRQKSAKATANDAAWTGRVRYAGLPGLDLAVSYQRQSDLHQSAVNGALGFAGEVPDADAELIEAHGRYTLAGLQLTAMVARWDIDSEQADIGGKDQQKGHMLEAAYRVLPAVGVFARHVNYDLAAGERVDSQVWVNTYGVNYWLHPQVVLKADYDNVNYDSAGKDDKKDDAINLGIGWSF